MPTQLRNQKILAWRGIISYTLIAKKLGISRSAVAGVCWRADWPKKNNCGLGLHGGGKHAAQTMRGSAA